MWQKLVPHTVFHITARGQAKALSELPLHTHHWPVLLAHIALGCLLLKFNTLLIIPFPFVWVMLNFWWQETSNMLQSYNQAQDSLFAHYQLLAFFCSFREQRTPIFFWRRLRRNYITCRTCLVIYAYRLKIYCVLNSILFQAFFWF